MVSANLNELELHAGTVAGNPEIEAHFAFPLFWATGNASTAVLCVELEPGKSGPRHVDMPEEILLIERGEVEVQVGEERGVFRPRWAGAGAGDGAARVSQRRQDAGADRRLLLEQRGAGDRR
jgi:hypothetical protein